MVTAIWESQMKMINVKHNRTEPQIYYVAEQHVYQLANPELKLYFLTKLLTMLSECLYELEIQYSTVVLGTMLKTK